MELTKRTLTTLSQALGYAVIYAKTESETADFVLLKLDIDRELTKLISTEKQKTKI